MSDISNILNSISEVASNPEKQLRKYINSGKQVIGCFPIYTPEVIANAAGIIPFGLWGGQVEFAASKKYLVSFACPIMHSCMELGLTGRYDGIKAVMIPAMCDTFRCVTQDFKAGVKTIETIPFTPPQNRVMEASRDYLVSEYEYVKSRIEAIYNVEISEENIVSSITLYNRHNEEMRRFANIAKSHLDIITPTIRHEVFKSAWFMPKEEHLQIMIELNNSLEAEPNYEYIGDKVILTGITFEPSSLLDMIAENGMAVVADDLAQETRQYRTDIPESGTALERLADQWRNRQDPMAHSESKDRGDLLLGLCKENDAKGVIVGLMKFCDPEEYDFVGYNEQIKKAGYPVLSIDIDQQPNNYDQARTRIEAFSEML